jgi:conjugative transfer signal peptidase TraF
MPRGLLDRLKNTNAALAERIAVSVCGLTLMTLILAGAAGIRINASPSLPVGLYVTSASPEADLVEFCPAEPYASFATARGYRSAGSCPDGASPLMKPLVASAGDLVDLLPKGISVNGRLVANTQPRSQDSSGRLLAAWPFGTYRVKPGTAWVASSYHSRSYDSRYFGPIQTSAIRNRVRPLITEW